MGVFSHLRVVEIGSSAATSYCARLFADFGADVQKVEPPTGDPLRRSAPLTPGDQSAWFAFLNFNKSSIVIDGDGADAVRRLTALIETCDILVDGRDVDPADCPSVDISAIRQRHSGLVYLEASWFGRSGPYAGFAATDSTIRALAGLIKLAGPVEGPPSYSPDFQTGIIAGLWGFIATAASVVARARVGRSWSLSIFEACLALSEYLMFEAFQHGDVMRRIGINRFWPNFPIGIYPTKKGWLGVTTVAPAQWRAFCDMLDLLELRDDPALILNEDRLQHMERIERQFIPRLKTRTAQQWFAEGLKRKIPIVPVPEISDLLQDAEKKERGAIVPVLLGEEVGLTAGSMQRLTLTPPHRGGRVPAPGEQQAFANSRRRQTGAASASSCSVDAGGLPLQGIRVIDFSMGWAGPLCTRMLADLGAEVIKVEAIQYPDWWRGLNRPAGFVAGRMYEKAIRFCMMNRNKYGITLDLKRTQGLDLAKRLLAEADIVVDNYSVDVLPKLGLGYDVLRTINPRLIMMSMSAFGTNSVHRNCRAYGSTLEQASGLPSVVGNPGQTPVMSHIAFGDAVGGLNGCAAVLVALIHARATGQGQFIDLAQIECMMPFAAPWIVVNSICSTPPVRYGNRHPQFVPHGCFRCAGEDNWILVAVTDEDMWQRLAVLIGRPDWAANESLKFANGRRDVEDEIESGIEAWTLTRDADEAMSELQAAGVAGGVARLPIDLLNDRHLRSRAFLQEVERAFVGLHPQPSMPIREGAESYALRTPAPTLGQHNGQILSGVLGLSDAEIAHLGREDIIGMAMIS
ncbi:crotonobetainyl-CoA:carnitine CoA-transferase CaiB-like acyl-CoA transferase [Bradyrhizobium sp. USDA 4524]|uniref:CaiB/BaiF CoA transferase family protein n=1 Tax=unclassified Bradyrhizobium TaxID=2631580 RepID=UPI00209DFB32|nr:MULTISPECIES: CoA transferase [unclassified Bradyrhizobium]MCP1838507.1 crotonobetainyl-CoA:carnitine CoA-transferase CaiB-like acyl-CoA transferase [Bradyrhizobium sp. USDA 4538]MCP1899071.1 crotonobetainyl-CoA:carnitine CoA-transferase CaiB-like acyl-CoA transferase [Bradyrhizobium sp. USDA 4537]MCP1986816.1 crotonobetainyl-CoA:carnitine CoA-transferase CaiB-like acyl-CoA transferase [Bradyrhizobium sp. USDA 4539]